MDSREIRNLVAELIKEHLEITELKVIGNQLNIFIDNTEFEIVIRTTRAERRISIDRVTEAY